MLSFLHPKVARFGFDRTQALLLVIFVLVNVGLFMYSVDTRPYPDGPLVSATYQSAADGQRYWGVALSLAEKGSFSVPPLWDSRTEYPLTRSGPLTSLIFAIPIKLLGFDIAPIAIVILQCALLYVMAFAARSLAKPFQVNPTLLQGLILFNPNLIGLSHLAQSDLLFAGLFTFFLSYFTRLMSQPDNIGVRSFLRLGVLLGLLTMTRDIGFAFSLFFPAALFMTIILHPARSLISKKRLVFGFFAGLLVYTVLITPWSIRNYMVFGQLSPTISQTSQLHYNYLRLKYLEGGNSEEQRNQYIAAQINALLVDEGNTHCAEKSPSTSHEGCIRALQKAYLTAIFSEPKLLISKAVVYAAVRTLFSGGSSRLVNYLGLSKNEPSASLMATFYGMTGLRNFMAEIKANGIGHTVIFFTFTGFTLLARLTGLIGIYWAFRHCSDSRYIQIFHLLIVGFFLVAYFAVSTSRFRAPLEPILMLYATIGLSLIAPALGVKNTHELK